jgi:hypothetical protein
MNKNEVEDIFINNGGILTTGELHSNGINSYAIKKLLNNGEIKRLKQGIYVLVKKQPDEWFETFKIVHKGIYCLFSAAQLLELSTFVPSEYHMAIPRRYKVSLPDYPPVKLYYWKYDHYALGIFRMNKNGHTISVYDREKTVCDFVKYRNKVGLDTTKEVLKNYLNSKGRNLTKLVNYSRELRVSSIMQQYLEVLV